MDEDDKELVCRLMAKATAMLEDTIRVAAAEQSSRLNPRQLTDTGRRLQGAARGIATIAEAAAIVADLGSNRPRKSCESAP